jgi:allophanate hydrolase subunit 1
MRVRAVGADALLLEVDDPAAWFAELWRLRAVGELTAVEIVPGARTVLLDGLADQTVTAELVRTWTLPAEAARDASTTAGGPAGAGTAGAGTAGAGTAGAGTAGAGTAGAGTAGAGTAGAGAVAGGHVEVPVVYDGDDLGAVAALWGTDVRGVIEQLSGTEFRVAFCGFTPGWAYLTGLPEELAVPRLETPRPRVPAGSVALADGYAGIYPSASPGGWRLVGRTDVQLFDPDSDPPALLTPGKRVRLVEEAAG